MDEIPAMTEMRCPACDWLRVLDPAEVVRELTVAGKLRTGKSPDGDVALELLRLIAAGVPCGGCGRIGLLVAPYDEEVEWDRTRRCEVCGEPIPPERLEVVPDTTVCVSCKGAEERGVAPAGQIEYCPRCGSTMTTEATAGRMTEYVMKCHACGYRGR